jgi:hypothetical protein
MNPAKRISVLMAGISAACVLCALVLVLAAPHAGLYVVLLLLMAAGSGTNAVIFWRARNRAPAPTPSPAIPLPPTYIPPAYDYSGSGRPIPWMGGTGRLGISRPLFGKSTRVTIDGVVVATPTRGTLADPWVECPLPGSDPQVTVVQAQLQPYVFRTLVFVDGASIDDGQTLDAWRARKPIALDGFEQTFFLGTRSQKLLGPRGAILIGVVCVLPFLVALQRNPTLFWAGAAALAFVIPAGWIMQGTFFMRWLRTKRSWPWRIRNLMVAFELVGVPILIILVLQAVTSSH